MTKEELLKSDLRDTGYKSILIKVIQQIKDAYSDGKDLIETYLIVDSGFSTKLVNELQNMGYKVEFIPQKENMAYTGASFNKSERHKISWETDSTDELEHFSIMEVPLQKTTGEFSTRTGKYSSMDNTQKAYLNILQILEDQLKICPNDESRIKLKEIISKEYLDYSIKIHEPEYYENLQEHLGKTNNTSSDKEPTHMLDALENLILALKEGFNKEKLDEEYLFIVGNQIIDFLKPFVQNSYNQVVDFYLNRSLDNMKTIGNN